jgi:CheY-like chemotaxis protein
MSGKRRALVVDDIEANRTMLKTFLYFKHFEVEMAADGLEARRLLEAKPFDLLVSDIEMPTMNGFELLAWVKRTPAVAKLPTVMLSTLDSAEVVERCRKLGADDYLVKPFTKEKIDGTLAKLGFAE